MKTLITLLLILPFISFSQTYDCQGIDKIISVQGGVPMNLSVEGGIQSDIAGAFIGAKFTVKNIKGNEIYPASQTANVNTYLKLTAHIFGGDDNLMRVYAISYIGKGIYGIGAKFAFLVSDYVLIFTEPEFTEAKMTGDIGLSFRF